MSELKELLVLLKVALKERMQPLPVYNVALDANIFSLGPIHNRGKAMPYLKSCTPLCVIDFPGRIDATL